MKKMRLHLETVADVWAVFGVSKFVASGKGRNVQRRLRSRIVGILQAIYVLKNKVKTTSPHDLINLPLDWAVDRENELIKSVINGYEELLKEFAIRLPYNLYEDKDKPKSGGK